MDCKRELRRRMVDRLRQLSPAEKQAYDRQIAAYLYRWRQWQEAKVVAITIAKETEVDTVPIIERAWQEGKTVGVPKCNPMTKTMTFRQIASFAQLEKAYAGLLEPIEEQTTALGHDEFDLIIVPGVCFTKTGYRIGYGGGYYDRYLQGITATTAALAYSFQVVEDIPVEDHDVPVEFMITDQGVIHCEP
ncbi:MULTISPECIES: 5-formyltetrahydrofolate cyclo-ligase [Geobacillus]|uniref:5-formyltetrahydrofolate cyclo-ligase n=2 Tax=Geobacillus thermodenitrificans TaxID=33940 RepID=A4IQY0_GEOTN|nr:MULTISPECIES: 5-formyltetrahydrofolate cyclo-ligase [Geobacillus]ABO67734.1 5-formyltetrahydrofolate cyclo-ligase family protein [Geobacillus thermodenitrificans NG80-2]MED3716093.1 5-formyltetrahydrofolate cyclo-ligase [Geobacillus thermodenitrificans]MED4918181.1 5-formyltetrahydrofolate cyclo-ligase [Geobacillus thermodenitrificans]NNU86947.1 5-formyltetrahydrofolate cyclo-ligase [Geobacillus sp. MR]WMV75358.1 5-formyltetrahydrofolate cyclo-ligase [Geobacillus thermodenitrificans]